MNALHVAAVATTVTFAFYALPTFAQQGPAGVPGVVELLIESVTPVIADEPIAPPPSVRPTSPTTTETPSENAAKEATSVAQPAKATYKGMKKTRKTLPEDCSKTTDPASCQLFQNARKTCQTQIGKAHRQCLRDVLTADR